MSVLVDKDTRLIVQGITGKEGTRFEGTARVFNSEEQALEKILDGTIKAVSTALSAMPSPEKLPAISPSVNARAVPMPWLATPIANPRDSGA